MLRFLDSHEHYSTVTDKYDFAFNVNITADGRFGDKSMRLGNADHYAQKVFDPQPTWIWGFGFKGRQVATGHNQPLFILYDDGSKQVDIRTMVIGPHTVLAATRNGTLLGTGTFPLVPLRYFYVQIAVTIDNTVGSVLIDIDGNTDLNLTGIDTQATANPSADIFHIGGDPGVGADRAIDIADLYVLDGQGSAPNNAFWGDTRVECLFPNGNGFSSDLVGQDANSTDNYLNVDDVTPDEDSTYNESGVVGDYDTYTFTNVTPTVGDVNGIQVLPRARKTDAGVRKICSVARLSGTEEDSDDKTLSTSYATLPDIREEKPGGGAWTISDVNSSEFGVKVTV